MVLADTEYNHQAAAEILPFRDVFNSLFFVSIGMLLSIRALLENLGVVVLVVVGLIAGKALIIWFVVRLLSFPQRIAAMTALGLAQIGEFSFVLAKTGQDFGLLPDRDYQVFLDASILSMIATPFLIHVAPRIGYSVQSLLKDGGIGEMENTEEDVHLTSSGGLQRHVIIVGYGLNGQNLAKVLRAVAIPYTILELNAQVVRSARAAGEKINFGDATRREVLIHAGVREAWTLVLAMSDAQAARRTLAQAKLLNKNLHVVVRTRYVSEISELSELGADEIIPQEFETSIEIFARVLHRYGTARNVIEAQIDRIRSQGYQMLRSPSLPAGKIYGFGAALESASTEMLQLTEDSPAVGRTLGDLNLRGKTGATVIAVTRGGHTKVSPGAKYTLEPGDTIVLLGTPEKIERAQEFLKCAAPVGGFNP
jgi:CPA2 family monovalent cation:H+ antiporter-2